MTPGSPEFIQALNEHQCQVGETLPGHPYTCGWLDAPEHELIGGDLGVLVATESGWLCPFCGYEQDYDFFEERVTSQPPLAAARPSVWTDEICEILRRRVASAIADYEDYLARATADGLDDVRRPFAQATIPIMLECLRRRQAALSGGGLTA